MAPAQLLLGFPSSTQAAGSGWISPPAVVAAVKQLRDDLDRRMSEHAVSSTGQVPERYREAVAEYFRQLSEMDR